MTHRSTITPEVKTNYSVGAILVDSWGWEQTNVDFYAIIKRSGDFVTIQMMKVQETFKGREMTSEVLPLEVDPKAKPIRRKVKSFNGEEKGFSLRDYAGGGWTKLWSGSVQTATHYA